jgi:hypothetical protein
VSVERAGRPQNGAAAVADEPTSAWSALVVVARSGVMSMALITLAAA